ncbi:DTW domain-containing protein [Kickxella alabastrina]|uniref:DTW domain-containing protein n=1 Tax=Kickxella alabastrina TaxID=61397 RepID=UPI00221FEF9F|nr:DTW domain-containing protein [Kickxella alabastrina]KAI7834613.1 DTW domain-containing protein [Kickxella alabastrina]
MVGAQPYDIEALKIEPKPVLDACGERLACDLCGKKTKFFCYFCCRPVPQLAGKIPQIRLPFKMDVIKHARELDGKSTAVHAKIIAPEDIEIITYSDTCLDDVDPSRTALLFPGPDAQDISELDASTFDRVIVIDGTWSQAKGMVHNSIKLRRMQKVTVKPRRTRFWRYQNLDDSFMATIEAIYFLYRDSFKNGEYDGEYDALMYFYKYFYDFIQMRTRAH